MKKIEWHLSIGFAGADQDGEFEVEDDATEDEIEEIAKAEAFDCIDWYWKPTDDCGVGKE